MTSNGRLGAWRLSRLTRCRTNKKTSRGFSLASPKSEMRSTRNWYDQIRSWAAEGKSIRQSPARSPTTYRLSAVHIRMGSSGERCRRRECSGPRHHGRDFGLPAQDFWIFDDSIVVHLNFNPDGTLISHELIDEPDMAKYRAWQETALKYSAPFSEWNART